MRVEASMECSCGGAQIPWRLSQMPVMPHISLVTSPRSPHLTLLLMEVVHALAPHRIPVHSIQEPLLKPLPTQPQFPTAHHRRYLCLTSCNSDRIANCWGEQRDTMTSATNPTPLHTPPGPNAPRPKGVSSPLHSLDSRNQSPLANCRFPQHQEFLRTRIAMFPRYHRLATLTRRIWRPRTPRNWPSQTPNIMRAVGVLH